MVLTLVTFTLPPKAGDKVLVGMKNLLIIYLFLLFFTMSLHQISYNLPFIGSIAYSSAIHADNCFESIIIIGLSIAVVFFSITLALYN